MDVIIEPTTGWLEGNYCCSEEEFICLSGMRVRVSELPTRGKLILSLYYGEFSVDVSECELEVFPEDANGCRSFAAMKVPPSSFSKRE